jgi:dCMP deaminase
VIKVQGEEKSKWDKMAFRVCDAVKEDSKDQSTQLGSVILGPGNEIRSTGYNSFPRGINDGHAYRQERPIKYHYMAHAEENAIANAARMGTPLKGCTLYCQWPPCSTCARLIIGSGIAEVHCREYDVPTRRTEEVIAACEMLVESSVNFVHGGLILLALYERTLKDGKSKTDTEG